MKANKTKLFLISIIVMILFVLIGSGIIASNETIEKTISVNVYSDHTGSYETSEIFISGNLKKSFLMTGRLSQRQIILDQSVTKNLLCR